MLVHGGRQLHLSQQPGRYDEQFEAKQSRGTSSLSSAKFTFIYFVPAQLKLALTTKYFRKNGLNDWLCKIQLICLNERLCKNLIKN